MPIEYRRKLWHGTVLGFLGETHIPNMLTIRISREILYKSLSHLAYLEYPPSSASLTRCGGYSDSQHHEKFKPKLFPIVASVFVGLQMAKGKPPLPLVLNHHHQGIIFALPRITKIPHHHLTLPTNVFYFGYRPHPLLTSTFLALSSTLIRRASPPTPFHRPRRFLLRAAPSLHIARRQNV